MTETKPQRYTRSDVLLRVFFLGAITPEQARAYLARLTSMYANQHEAMREIERAIDWEEEGNLTAYGRIALEWGLRFNAMGREWAEWAVQQIA